MIFPFLWHLVIYLENFLPFLCSLWVVQWLLLCSGLHWEVVLNVYCVWLLWCRGCELICAQTLAPPCYCSFGFTGGTVTENGRHQRVSENAADLSGTSVVPAVNSTRLPRWLIRHQCILNLTVSRFSRESQSSVISWHSTWSEVAQLCPTLRNPSSSLHGILQARVLEWVAIAFSDTQHTLWK